MGIVEFLQSLTAIQVLQGAGCVVVIIVLLLIIIGLPLLAVACAIKYLGGR